MPGHHENRTAKRGWEFLLTCSKLWSISIYLQLISKYFFKYFYFALIKQTEGENAWEEESTSFK